MSITSINQKNKSSKYHFLTTDRVIIIFTGNLTGKSLIFL